MSPVRPTMDTAFANLTEALELSLEDEPPRHHKIVRPIKLHADKGYDYPSCRRMLRHRPRSDRRRPGRTQ